MIEVSSICHSYGDGLETLRDVTFSLDEKQIIVIFGPNGCGKTTLANIVCGYVKPNSGFVRVDGKLVVGPSKDVIMIPQKTDLLPWKTVEGNLKFALNAAKIDRTEERSQIDRFLEMANLTDFRDSYPNQLSGGMEKKVSLARVFLLSPKLIVMDEPFAPLDYLTRQNLHLKLMEFHERIQLPLMIVSHDVEEAVFLSDRIYVLTPRPGRIMAEITVDIPYPRTPSIKLTQEFRDIRSNVTDAFEAGISA